MKGLSLLAAVLLLAGTALAQSIPNSVLNSKSIFVRGTPTDGETMGDPPPQLFAPPPVFVGVLDMDGRLVGLLETTRLDGTSYVSRVQEGDEIAWDHSQVREVTMDVLHLVGGSQAAALVSIGRDLRNESPNPAAAIPLAGRAPARLILGFTPRPRAK
jgi:hypothetical protein